MKKILIVDDDRQIRSMLRRLLERHGYEVREAENGLLGRETLETWPANLMICDIMMPEEEGLGTIRRVTGRHPGLKIIAISGGGLGRSGDYLELAGRLGATRTLAKPLKIPSSPQPWRVPMHW